MGKVCELAPDRELRGSQTYLCLSLSSHMVVMASFVSADDDDGGGDGGDDEDEDDEKCVGVEHISVSLFARGGDGIICWC